MNPVFPNPSIDRRRLLRNGGLLLGAGAVLAACGEGVAGTTDPGRIGIAPPGSTLPEAEVNDVVLLRTAQSIEYTAIDVYGALTDQGLLDGWSADLVGRFVEDHTGHASSLGELITSNGGEEFQCANPWVVERAVTRITAAIESSDDAVRDALNTAFALESWAAATYQAIVESLTTAELRQASMIIGIDENRHAAALAIDITGSPAAYVSPGVAGDEVLPDENGFAIPYAIPASFGQLGSADLVVGQRDAEGARTTVTLQTPAQNTFVYEYMSC